MTQDPSDYYGQRMAAMLGLPIATQVHAAVRELLGLSPWTVRHMHRGSDTIQAPVRTEESPQAADTVPRRVSSRARGRVTTPTTGFSAPR